MGTTAKFRAKVYALINKYTEEQEQYALAIGKGCSPSQHSIYLKMYMQLENKKSVALKCLQKKIKKEKENGTTHSH